MKTLNVCTHDLGGGSGKMFMGAYDGNCISLEEVHRYPFGMTRVGEDFYWQFAGVMHNVLEGLGKAAHLSDGKLRSFAASGFGNSLVLLDKNGRMFTPSYCDYHKRMRGVSDDLFQRFGKLDLHMRTGTDVRDYQSIMLLNAYALNNEGWVLEQASTVMQHVDALKYFLTGEKYSERTAASISGLYDPHTGDWDEELTDLVRLSRDKLPAIVDPCTRMAQVLPWVKELVGLKSLLVCNAAQHDTASASLAIPSTRDNPAFLSIGTFALSGIEMDQIITNETTLRYAIGNEANPYGKNRFLCSCRAMWYLEKCKAYMERKGKEYAYQELVNLAEQEQPMRFFIDLENFDYFTAADTIPHRIVRYCQESGQGKIERFSQVVRCIFDSLALTVSQSFQRLSEVSAMPVECIYAIGGGARNGLLCQTLANITGKTVSAGPYEASTMGLVAAQLAALGELRGLKQIRTVIANSVSPLIYEPSLCYDMKWANHFEQHRL